jgi:hypothetical protein
MKGESRTILLGIITALILVVNGLEAGAVLEPATFDPRPPAVAAMISAQQYELIGLISAPKSTRRSVAMNAGNRGLFDDADSHERSTCSPPYNDCWASNLD